MHQQKKNFLLAVLAAMCLFLFGGAVNTIFSYTGFGYYASLVEGDSMKPNLQNGDVLVYGPYSELEEGDIVRYSNENADNEIVHRIVEIDHRRVRPYKIKGDNNPVSDGWFEREDIISEVEYRVFNLESAVPIARKTMSLDPI